MPLSRLTAISRPQATLTVVSAMSAVPLFCCSWWTRPSSRVSLWVIRMQLVQVEHQAILTTNHPMNEGTSSRGSAKDSAPDARGGKKKEAKWNLHWQVVKGGVCVVHSLSLVRVARSHSLLRVARHALVRPCGSLALTRPRGSPWLFLLLVMAFRKAGRWETQCGGGDAVRDRPEAEAADCFGTDQRLTQTLHQEYSLERWL